MSQPKHRIEPTRRVFRGRTAAPTAMGGWARAWLAVTAAASLVIAAVLVPVAATAEDTPSTDGTPTGTSEVQTPGTDAGSTDGAGSGEEQNGGDAGAASANRGTATTEGDDAEGDGAGGDAAKKGATNDEVGDGPGITPFSLLAGCTSNCATISRSVTINGGSAVASNWEYRAVPTSNPADWYVIPATGSVSVPRNATYTITAVSLNPANTQNYQTSVTCSAPGGVAWSPGSSLLGFDDNGGRT